MDIRKVYEYALQREYEGKRFFEQSAERLKHASVVGAFRRLAREEQKHIRFIERLLDALGEGEVPEPEDADVDLEGDEFFSKRAASEMLDQTMMESMVPDLSVLRMAYLIERDFVEFYESAAEQAEGDAQEALEMLARWERGHERFFKQLHDSAFETYAGMPWGG
jgi:rubrerythrin